MTKALLKIDYMQRVPLWIEIMTNLQKMKSCTAINYHHKDYKNIVQWSPFSTNFSRPCGIILT